MAAPRLDVIPLGQLHESPHNIRRHIDPVGLRDLIASVKTHGVLTPLLARPNKKGFELAAGHRRLRAATEAGLPDVPVLIREMDDREFMEVLITENLQRVDVHPLDEALGYEALQKADRIYTPEGIAAKVGKPVSYVYRRMKLLKLVPEARKHLEENHITVTHGEVLARLTPAQQKQALDECLEDTGRPLIDDPNEDRIEPRPLSHLEEWIDRHVKTDIEAQDTAHYFPEIADELETEAETLLQLSESSTPGAFLGTKKHGTIGSLSWTEIRSKKDECPNTRKGVVVHGGPMRIVRCCAQKGCPKHRPPQKRHTASASKGTSPEARAKQEAKAAEVKRARELEEARRDTVEARAIDEALQGLTTLSDDVLREILVHLLEGDVRHDEFNKRFQTKCSWGTGAKALKSLSREALQQGIVFCLLSDTFANAYSDFKYVDALLKLFGVNRLQIDKEVATEQAVQERAAGFSSGECRFCGCTEDNACPGGCSWLDAEETVCSAQACAKKFKAEQKTAGKKR